MKLVLEDFLQYEYGEFVFEPGVTILSGLTGAGKSTIIWALYGVLCNLPAMQDCIRHGQKQCRVTLENNGGKLTWVRTQNSSCYIDSKGEEYVKASKLDSRDFGDFGFYFDNKGRVINIHDQWCVLFPFGESDTDMFKLFEDIFNISCSVPILDEIKKDETSYKSTAENHTANIEYNNKLMQDCKTLLQTLDEDKLQDCITQLTTSENLCNNIQKDYQSYSQSCKFKGVQLPECFDVSLLYNNKDCLDTIQKDFLCYKNNKERCNWTVPELDYNLLHIDDISCITNDYEQYCSTKALIHDYTQQIEELDKELQQLQDRISTIKVCPTCGRPLEEK